MKAPKFMRRVSPKDPAITFIYHTQHPRFLAAVNNNNIEIIDDIDNLKLHPKSDQLLQRMLDWNARVEE